MRSSFLRAIWLLLPSLLGAVDGHGTEPGFAMKAHHTHNIGLANANDTAYTVDITLGGQNFTVLLDTGSSDLWINAQGRHIAPTNTTDVMANETYGQGQAQGNLAFAELRVGDYVVPSQIFLNATEVMDVGLPIDGFLGMSFDVSSIYAAVLTAWGESANTLGRSFITNLFAQNTSLPNNFDLQLGRLDRMDDTSDGTFIIGGHSSAFGDVAEAPKLPRVVPDRWAVTLDEMKVNGERFSFNKSSVSGVPEGKVVALLDSGFSAPPLPPAAVDAIYRTIPGSAYWPTGNGYVIPCNSSTMLSFTFGGKEYPVHPLDLALPLAVPIVKDGAETNVTICFATYQYLSLDPTSFAGFDLILGDAFLRNVYASFDYGDFDPVSNTEGTPFVQMVSTVDVHTAMDEFHSERTAALADLPPTIDPAQFIRYPLAPSAGGPAPSASSGTQDDAVRGALSDSAISESGEHSDSKFTTAVLALLGANLAVGLMLLGVTLTMCVRGVKGRTVSSRYVPVRLRDADAGDRDAEHGVLRYSD